MGHVEACFDYPETEDREDGVSLSRWLAQRFADGWSWGGEHPRVLVVNGTQVHRFRFFRETSWDARPAVPRQSGLSVQIGDPQAGGVSSAPAGRSG
jgi:hypothetical protein